MISLDFASSYTYWKDYNQEDYIFDLFSLSILFSNKFGFVS